MDVITESYLRLLENNELQRLVDYLKYDTYYNNKQLINIPEKYKDELDKLGIRRNYMSTIVDACVAKLRVKGIRTNDDNTTKKLEEIWNFNRMDALMYKLHRIALKKGDCYALVWIENDIPTIKVFSPEFVTPVPSPEDEDKILFYKKQWNIEEGNVVYTRKDVFYPDRIERYISRAGENFRPYEDDGLPAVFENKFNVIPIVHFKNRIDEGIFGVSELRDAIPIQDDINRIVLDTLLDADYLGFGQIWIAGVTLEDIKANNPQGLDRNPGSGWIFPSENTRVEKLVGESLSSFIEAVDEQINELATITRTPLFYLKPTAQPVAGVSLERLESPFLDKINEIQTIFGNAYEDINRLILLELGMNDVSTTILWQSEKPSSEEVRNDISLNAAGIISRKEVLRKQGYDSNEIKQMEKEINEEVGTPPEI